MKKSFSFLEVLVVVAVLGIVLPAFFAIFYTILIQQVKVYRLSEVKRQGDSLTTFLENTFRNNAYTIYNGATEICQADPAVAFPHNGTPTSFQNVYDSVFSISNTTTSVSLSYPNPVAPAPTFAFPAGQLNNLPVDIKSFTITCTRSGQYSAPVIAITYTATYHTTSTNPNENASLPYQLYIKLRSFPTQ